MYIVSFVNTCADAYYIGDKNLTFSFTDSTDPNFTKG